MLSDDGPLTDARTGHEHTQPDVVCHLTTRQACQLAEDLPTTTTTQRPTA